MQVNWRKTEGKKWDWHKWRKRKNGPSPVARVGEQNVRSEKEWAKLIPVIH